MSHEDDIVMSCYLPQFSWEASASIPVICVDAAIVYHNPAPANTHMYFWSKSFHSAHLYNLVVQNALFAAVAFDKQLANPSEEILTEHLVATSTMKDIRAFAFGVSYTSTPKERIWIEQVVSHFGHSREGYGTAVVTSLLLHLKQLGYIWADLTCSPKKGLHNYYTRFGFTETKDS